MKRFAESRLSPFLMAVGYLALAGVAWYVVGVKEKPLIEVLLLKLIPQLLWVNFLLIAISVVFCRRDIADAFMALYVAPQAPRGEEKSRLDRCLGFLNRPGIWLILIVAIGLFLVSQVAPQIHRIYYDEDIYANMGQNIAYAAQAGMANYGTFEYGEYFAHWIVYNKDPSGWPFLMGLVFQLFGTDEAFAFHLNNLLFGGGVLIVFFITRMLMGGNFPGLLAALIYALIPHNLLWASTLAAENAAAVFGGLTVLCMLIWLRTRTMRHLLLLAAVLPFACHMRPESSLIALWALAAVALNPFSAGAASQRENALGEGMGTPGTSIGKGFPHPLATRAFWAAGLIAFALIIPLLWHFYAVSGQSWGAQGAKFAVSFFRDNVAINGPYFFNNKEFPLLFSLLALVGLAAWALPGKDKEKRPAFRPALLLMLWFVLFWGIFLFFYAGSYKYGADVRFALVCFMPLAVLAGIGGGALHARFSAYYIGSAEATAGSPSGSGYPLPFAALLIAILFLSWMKFTPLIRTIGQEAWGARYDHNNAKEFIKKIPDRSIVLTHIPTMFLLWGQNAIQAYAGINNPEIIQGLLARYDGHVYYHKNYWCNTQTDANRAICDGIVQRYDLEPVSVAREQNYEYGLYRMTFKNRGTEPLLYFENK